MGMTIKSKEVIKYREEEHKVPLVLYEIIVDRIGELPTNPIVEDEEIAQGSIAWVVEAGEFYGYTSTGSWINQKDGGAAPVLIEKTITENGTYNALSDNADGYSSVTVNVPSGGGETFEFSVTVTAEKTGEEQMPATLVSNKTYSEIVSAFNNGDKIKPTITINTIDGGETITSILTVAVCTLTEQALWLCGCEDFDSAVYSITWVENATTGILVGSDAGYIVIAF